MRKKINKIDENVHLRKRVAKKHGPKKATLFVGFIDVLAIAFLVLINTTFFKSFFIPTAMATMKHQYLAYTLYSKETINKVMSSNYIEQTTEKINLDEVTIGDTSEKKHYSSKYEKEIYTRDAGNELYKIIPISEDNFKGFLTVIYDPADVELATPKNLGRAGASVNTLCKENGGLVGINGGGFEDLDGWGDGSTAYGSIIEDGKLIWTHSGGSGELIGFTKSNKLLLTSVSATEAISEGMEDAIEFGPNLIVNGKVSTIHGDGGWGTAPRTIIAQRKDGIVLFLIIDGRQPGYSIGATMNDVIEVLLRYKAYNAANLDGGASTTMSVNGKLYNKPSAGGSYGGRYVSNAWIVTNKNNKKVPTSSN